MKHTYSFFLKALSLGSFLSLSFFTHTAERKRIKQDSTRDTYFFSKMQGVFICRTCGIKKDKSSHMLTHQYVHSTKKYPCLFINKDGTRCELAFKRPDGVIRHQRESHTNKKPFPCLLCPNWFKRIEHLTTHRENVHKDDPQDDDHKDQKVADSDDATLTEASDDAQEQQPDGQTCTASQKSTPKEERSPLVPIGTVMASLEKIGLKRRFALLAAASVVEEPILLPAGPTASELLRALEVSLVSLAEEPDSPHLPLDEIERILLDS